MVDAAFVGDAVDAAYIGDAVSARFKITQVSFTTQNCINPSKVSSLNPHTPNLASC